jgi:hypothetical protein
MPIDVPCPCGGLYRVPDSGAGKRVQCKRCGRILDVPGGDRDLDIEVLPGPPSTRPCPYCAEPIAIAARKCRHCGEYLTATLRRRRPEAAGPPVVHGRDRGRRWSPGVAAVLSLFFPGVGQIYKGDVLLGLLWLVAVPLGYLCFLVPGLVLHLLCILTAAAGNPDR